MKCDATWHLTSHGICHNKRHDIWNEKRHDITSDMTCSITCDMTSDMVKNTILPHALYIFIAYFCHKSRVEYSLRWRTSISISKNLGGCVCHNTIRERHFQTITVNQASGLYQINYHFLNTEHNVMGAGTVPGERDCLYSWSQPSYGVAESKGFMRTLTFYKTVW